MAQRLIRLTLYDDAILSTLDRLSRVRKQSMFVVEALRHFLETKEGQQLLLALTKTATSNNLLRKERDERECVEKKESSIDAIFKI